MVRRKECRAIAEALGGLEGSWVEMEVVLRRGLEGLKSDMEMVGFLLMVVFAIDFLSPSHFRIEFSVLFPFGLVWVLWHNVLMDLEFTNWNK